VTDQIQEWTAEISADPDSLAFLPLAEALRRRGHLDSALAVARHGVARYPDLAEAHDLLGRIHSDRGEGDAAFDAWTMSLRLEPEAVGPLKGLGFLSFRMGDLPRSLRQLEAAATLAPGDPTLSIAIARVREQMRAAPEAPPPDPYIGREGWDGTTMLVDHRGRRLAGTLRRKDGVDASDEVAAQLAGVSREASRAAVILDLGHWQALYLEGPSALFVLTEPTDETLLVIGRGPDTPPGRLPLIADRATALARRWLERLA